MRIIRIIWHVKISSYLPSRKAMSTELIWKENPNLCFIKNVMPTPIPFWTLQATVLGIFAGTLFYKLGGQYDQQQMNSVRSLGFVSTMSILLLNQVQLPLCMLQRPIFYKHRAQRFFRPSSYVVAHSIVNLPQTLLEVFFSITFPL